MPSYRTLCRLTLALCVFALSPALVFAEAPLHQRIDQAIAAGQPDFAHRAAGPASDAEFLRRVYLDLTGTIPTPAQTRDFLKDTSPSKRLTLIDRLLVSPEYAR